jgi:non-heme Fe2+,alpha-ketoglutarate-dependent halogenase
VNQWALKRTGKGVPIDWLQEQEMSIGFMSKQVKQYHCDGFLFPIHVISAAEAEAARLAVQNVARQCNIPLSRLPKLHEYFQWAYDLAAHPCMLGAVEMVLGPDLIVWGTLVLSKEPGSRGMVPWHQDRAYAGFLQGTPSISAWIALTPVTSKNGCLRVIRASHGILLPFTNQQEKDEMLSRGQRVTTEINEADAVDIVLQPGEASLHDDTLIHGSNSNYSDGPRTGFIIRYSTPAMSQPEFPVFCVRGNAGALHCQQPPARHNEADAYRRYAEYARSQNQRMGEADQ